MTSGAVASALSTVEETTIPIIQRVSGGSTMYLYKYGKVVFFSLPSDWLTQTTGYNRNLGTIPQGFRPKATIAFKEWTTINITLFVNTSGEVYTYNYSNAISQATNGNYTGCWITN